MLNVGSTSRRFCTGPYQGRQSHGQSINDLKLDKLDCYRCNHQKCKEQQNGQTKISSKIECPIENLDLDILGFIDHNITVNIIKDEKIVEKKDS